VNPGAAQQPAQPAQTKPAAPTVPPTAAASSPDQPPSDEDLFDDPELVERSDEPPAAAEASADA